MSAQGSSLGSSTMFPSWLMFHGACRITSLRWNGVTFPEHGASKT